MNSPRLVSLVRVTAMMFFLGFAADEILNAQSSGVGLIPNNTFQTSAWDKINLSNGNIYFTVPIRAKREARGTTLNIELAGNSSAYLYVKAPGGAPVFGIHSGLSVNINNLVNPYWGQNILFSQQNTTCPNGTTTTVYYNFSALDGTGAAHPFTGQTDTSQCYPQTTTSVAGDGSGYTLSLGPGSSSGTLYNVAGSAIAPGNINDM